MLAQGLHSYNWRAEDMFPGRKTGKRDYKFCPPVSVTFICLSLMFLCCCAWGICTPVFVIKYSLASLMQMTTGMHQGPADWLRVHTLAEPAVRQPQSLPLVHWKTSERCTVKAAEEVRTFHSTVIGGLLAPLLAFAAYFYSLWLQLGRWW